MKIETKTTLIFTITSENPPHTTAVEFIKAAAKRYQSEVEVASCPMPEGAFDIRQTEFRITDGDAAHLERLADGVRDAMRMIGVEMSEQEKAA